MSHLERQIEAPTAAAKRVADLVTAMPSETTRAPRNLSATLLGRLREIERQHGGHVPLHGRLFAQWMHHAYPRECPYPHEAGALSPQTPDEWMRETGEESTKADVEERKKARVTQHLLQRWRLRSGTSGPAGPRQA